MLRQILSCVACLLGILFNLLIWYKLLDLAEFFARHQLNPSIVLVSIIAWALAGGVSCLFLAKHMAQWTMKLDLLPLGDDAAAAQLQLTLSQAAQNLGLKTLPAIGIYERAERNAFVAGPGPRRGVVAVSRGLLQNVQEADLELLLTRELLQLKSHDTAAIAIMQGMTFAFTLYVARMLSFLLGTSLRTSEDDASSSSDSMELLLSVALTILLTLPGSMVLWLFCRSSTFRADRATANNWGVPPLVALFKSLQGATLQLIRREPFSDGTKLLVRPYPSWAQIWFAQASLDTRIKRLS